MLRSLKHLQGFTLHALDGEIGAVRECYFDDRTWTIRYLIVKTGWLFGREVLISPRSLDAVNEQEQSIATNLTREQIEGSPLPETDKPLSRQFEEQHHDHYGYAYYWSAGTLWGLPMPGDTPPPVPREMEQTLEHAEQTGDPSLRSTAEIKGYAISAIDGQIGNVSDYIVDDHVWEIRYFVVDTGGWLPGRQVLVAPPWIRNISWHKQSVILELARDDIGTAPEYDPGSAVTPDYEEQLARHYRREVLRPGNDRPGGRDETQTP